MNCRAPQGQELQIELCRLMDPSPPMIKLASTIDWNAIAAMWHDSNGRPAIDTRLMVSLHDLKCTFDLSGEAVIEGWGQNPYWQHLGDLRYFQHRATIDPSSIIRWCSRAPKSGRTDSSPADQETKVRCTNRNPAARKNGALGGKTEL